MAKITLPANNLFDIFVALSFYKICDNAKIRFEDNQFEVMHDDDSTVDSLIKKIKDYIKDFLIKINPDAESKEDHLLFLTKWIPKKIKRKKNYVTVWNCCVDDLKNNISNYRWLINESLTNQTKKSDEQKMFQKSPLMLASRNTNEHTMFHKLCGTMGSLIERISADTLRYPEHTDHANSLSTYALGMIPEYYPDNLVVKPLTDNTLRFKSVLAMTGMTLFPTHIASRKITIDGYHDKVLNIPLPIEFSDLPTWQSMIRHPNLKNWRKNKKYWVEIIKTKIRTFALKNKNKSNYFEECFN